MSWLFAAARALALCAAAAAPAAVPRAVRFKTADGWTIAGLYKAPRKAKPVAILIHGVAAGKGEWDRFAPELWKLGMGTLAIDLRGHGESTRGPQGAADYRGFDAAGEWPRAEEDLAAALKFLKGKGLPPSRAAWIGASIGANLASRAAAADEPAPWVILLSPGQDYRGVGLAALDGGKTLVAASGTDPYALQTCLSVAATPGGPKLLEARSGHGVQMFDDPDFLAKLLDWIRTRPAGRPGSKGPPPLARWSLARRRPPVG